MYKKWIQDIQSGKWYEYENKKKVYNIYKKNILINKKTENILLYTKLIQHVQGDFAKKNLLYKILKKIIQ